MRRAITTFSNPDGSLLANYAASMGEAIVRRRAEIAVRAARVESDLAIKARSEFLANMNHELRTPLNAIIGFSTMLKEGDTYKLDPEQQRNYFDYILQSADLLLGHINTILEVASLESGSVEVCGDEVDMGDILDAAIERATIRSEAAKVSIERRDEGVEVIAWGDMERTGQALDHLLQTAVKSCDEGGRILVRTCHDDLGWAEIAVRDDGAGLSKDEVREALEAFSETQRGLDRSFSGPGVGYAVAKAFVEMQGGRFFIKSRKGAGTLVRMNLPPLTAVNGENNTTNTDGVAEKRDDYTLAPTVERAEDAA